jgi:hypothetical protein
MTIAGNIGYSKHHTTSKRNLFGSRKESDGSSNVIFGEGEGVANRTAAMGGGHPKNTRELENFKLEMALERGEK